MYNDENTFEQASDKLLELGFFLGFEQICNARFGEQPKYRVYINPDNYVVISLEEAGGGSINTCSLYSSWKLNLSNETSLQDFIEHHYNLGGETPSFYNRLFRNKDTSIIQTMGLSRNSFQSIVGVYNLLVNNVLFLPWNKQPNMWLLTHEEQRDNPGNYNKISNLKLLVAINKLGLNPSNFAIPK